MKISHYLLFLFLFTSSISYSQSNYKISGVVQDTLGEALLFSTVMLLDLDSTMISFTRTEADGRFELLDIAKGDYILKTTYVGYLPLHKSVHLEGKDVNMGILQMSEIASELMEVVIKAAKAPMVIRGDTIEYDVSTFKVPEGSSVEDLLKRLPGLEIEHDGSITSEGSNVDKVTVDGKDFFGSDPKAATKNLPAEGISKVSIFETKTEESEITGNTSNTDSKTMDLKLKDDFKSGGFGRIVAGIGTESRAELKGNYNRFNEKIQFSLVGVGNNTGRNGLGWNDYQDFMGSQSFNFSSDGDYGFSSGGNRYFVFGGGNNGSIESNIQSIFFNDGRGGLPENYNGGLNFNYDHKKTKISTVYFYNNSFLNKTLSSKSSKLQKDFLINTLRDENSDNDSQGHRAEFSFTQELDTFHTIKFEGQGAYVDEENETISNLLLQNEAGTETKSESHNVGMNDGYLGKGLLVLRKKFKKNGRRLGFNTSYQKTQLNSLNLQNSNIEYYTNEVLEDTEIIERESDKNQNKTIWKANLLYVDKFGKNFSNETFYNFSDRSEFGDADIKELDENNTFVRDEFLSRSYDNQVIKNRIGNTFRYKKGFYNMAVGLAYQHFILNGLYSSLSTGEVLGNVDKTYQAFIPFADFRYSPSRSSSLSLTYSNDVVEPSVSQLQPIIDNTNPLYITEGNPALEPTVSHNISLRLRKSYLESGIRLRGNLYYTNNTTDIINQETVDDRFITYVTPINYDGGDNLSGRLYFSMPLVMNKLKIDLSYKQSLDMSYAFVNGQLNKTRKMSYRPSFGIDITPVDDIGLFIDFSANLTDSKYEINTSQNQKYSSYDLYAQLNTKLFFGLFATVDLDYNYYTNTRYNLKQSVPILNASIYRFFMKENRLEIRLSMYDVLKKNVGFSQNAYGSGFSETKTNVLGQYIMLSATYNIKGLKSDLDKRGFW